MLTNVNPVDTITPPPYLSKGGLAERAGARIGDFLTLVIQSTFFSL